MICLFLPHAARAGSWSAPVYDYSGSNDFTYTDSQGKTTTENTPWYDPGYPDQTLYDTAGYIRNGESGTIHMHGTITATLTWIHDDPAHPEKDPVPSTNGKIYLRQYGDAEWFVDTSGSNPPGSGSGHAADGLGDSDANPSNVFACATYSGQSTGYHLTQQNASDTVTCQWSIDVTASATSDPKDGSGVNYGGYFTYNPEVVIDRRGAAISSNLEPTYHKSQTTGQPEQNQRTSSGFMVADTVAPLSGQTTRVTYSPIYDRTQWGSGSQYHWQSNDYSPDLSGTFNTFFFPDVPSSYSDYTNPPTGPGANDYITLTLTDSNDGAVATNNYSVIFHDYYEQWARTATLDHPGSFLESDGSINPERTYVVLNDNDSPASPSVSLSQAYTDSVTESGEIGGQAQLSAPGVAALQKNESITVGQTCTGTITASYQFAGAPWTSIKYYVAKTYQERWGTCDVYAANGFQGTANWYGVSATNPMALSLHSDTITQYPH